MIRRESHRGSRILIRCTSSHSEINKSERTAQRGEGETDKERANPPDRNQETGVRKTYRKTTKVPAGRKEVQPRTLKLDQTTRTNQKLYTKTSRCSRRRAEAFILQSRTRAWCRWKLTFPSSILSGFLSQEPTGWISWPWPCSPPYYKFCGNGQEYGQVEQLKVQFKATHSLLLTFMVRYWFQWCSWQGIEFINGRPLASVELWLVPLSWSLILCLTEWARSSRTTVQLTCSCYWRTFLRLYFLAWVSLWWGIDLSLTSFWWTSSLCLASAYLLCSTKMLTFQLTLARACSAGCRSSSSWSAS